MLLDTDNAMLNPRVSRFAVLVVILVGWTTACSETVQNPGDDFEPLPEWKDERSTSEQELQPQELNDEVFVDAQRVRELRDEQEATVVDVRVESQYEEGHLPGAVHSGHRAATDEQESYKPFKNPEYQSTLHRDVGHLQGVARDMGIYNDRPVILYGTPASKKVGRLFWSLEYLGHGSVYIYTPGYEQLKNALQVEASTRSVDKQGDFTVRRRESVLATSKDVERIAAGDKEGILIDTRRKSEFVGEEQRGNPRGGYIPEASWYHWEEVFTEQDGKRVLRPKEKLRSELSEAGLFEDGVPLVPYCETGTRSAYTYATLRWLDAEKPQNYDGSWRRWSRIPNVPVSHDGESQLDEK